MGLPSFPFFHLPPGLSIFSRDAPLCTAQRRPLLPMNMRTVRRPGRRPGLMVCRPFRADTEGFQLADNSSPNGAAIREPGASPRAVVGGGGPRVHGRSKPASSPVWSLRVIRCLLEGFSPFVREPQPVPRRLGLSETAGPDEKKGALEKLNCCAVAFTRGRRCQGAARGATRTPTAPTTQPRA